MTAPEGLPRVTIQLDFARPVSTGVSMTTTWSAARATRRVSRSAFLAMLSATWLIRRLNWGSVWPATGPLQVLGVKAGDQPDEVLTLIVRQIQRRAVVGHGHVGDWPQTHAHLTTRRQIQKTLVV